VSYHFGDQLPQDDLTITIQSLQHGQAGPYQDSKYRSRIIVTGRTSWHRATEEQIKTLARVLVRPWEDTPSSPFAPKLTIFRRESADKLDNKTLGAHREVWLVEITEMYTD
jgi:2'-5' RNA ligase